MGAIKGVRYGAIITSQQKAIVKELIHKGVPLVIQDKTQIKFLEIKRIFFNTRTLYYANGRQISRNLAMAVLNQHLNTEAF